MNTDRTYTKTALRLLMAVILCLFIIAPALAATITYEYYDDSQIKKVTYPDGYAITYTYDNSGNRLSSLVTAPPDTTPDAFAFIGRLSGHPGNGG